MLKARGPRARAVLLTLVGKSAALSTPVFRSNGSCSGHETEIFGQVSDTDAMRRWLRDAQREANDLDLPLVVVDNSHLMFGLQQPSRTKLVIHAEPEWRAELFGRSKLSAARFAEKHLSAPPLLSEEVASAFCLRAWAERAPEVLRALNKRRAA